MRFDTIDYGPHSRGSYNYFYYYDETFLQYGQVLDDEDDTLGLTVVFENTGTISGFGLYIIEYIGAPDYQMAFCTVSGTPDASGDSIVNFNPDTHANTELYNNSQWQTFEPDVVGSGWSWIDLAVPVNVTKGDIASMVITPSGEVVPSVTDKCEINTESTFWNGYPGYHTWLTSYWNHYSWEMPIGMKYTDGSIQGICVVDLPWYEYSSPAEWGVEFKLPFSATAVGGAVNIYPGDTYPYDGPFKLILTDVSDAELASVTITDNAFFDGWDGDTIHFGWDTATDPILDAGVTYRLVLKPTSAEAVACAGLIMSEEATKNLLPGGADWKWIERSTPASGWTYHPTYYPWISITVADITGGSTGGGGGSGQTNSSYGFIG